MSAVAEKLEIHAAVKYEEGQSMMLQKISMKIKKSMFDVLTGILRKSANLDVHYVSIGIGQVAFLDNVKKSNINAETLVLIHGLGADRDTWLQISKFLTKRYRLIVPDLPGHGESTQDGSINYSVDEQVQRVLELLKLHNIEHAHFVGSSMGGAVVIKLAYMQPEIVSSLILIDSYGAVKTPSYIDNLIEEIGHNPMLEISNKNDYKIMMSLAMVKPPYIPGFMLDVLVANMKMKKGLNKMIFEESKADSDLTTILPNIESPTLVIWGADDKVLHIDSADVFSR
ncbi:MAG: abhydrolase domain-containing protein 6, partial [Granulosicoccus sp.]